jgi:hypothetical protein
MGFQVCLRVIENFFRCVLRVIENSLLLHFVVKICVFGKFYSGFTAQHLVYCLLYVFRFLFNKNFHPLCNHIFKGNTVCLTLFNTQNDMETRPANLYYFEAAEFENDKFSA